MTTERFKIIVDTCYLFATTIGVIVALFLGYKEWIKKEIIKVRENSVGAAALESIRGDVKKNTDSIEDFHKDLEEIRRENRETSREYLNTLKDLANRFKN